MQPTGRRTAHPERAEAGQPRDALGLQVDEEDPDLGNGPIACRR